MNAPTRNSGSPVPDLLARTYTASLERASLASDELRRSARAVRLAHSKSVSRLSFAVALRIGYRTFGSMGRSRTDLYGFVAFFVIPATLAVVYFALIASSQYTAEARFAVRGGERPAADAISALTGLGSLTQIQDSMIVVNYVKSRALVEALDREAGLREVYGRKGIDWFSRFDADDSIEELVDYWQWHVKTSIEKHSGIVTVKVSAFSPQEALRVANATVALSERLVDGLSSRSRQDAVNDAAADLGRAELRLVNARIALRDFRNQQATLDPQLTAEGLNRLISELRMEKIRLEQELTAAQRANVNDEAPQVQIMRRRAEVIGEQMFGLEQLLTSQDGSNQGTVAGKMTKFDDLKLEQEIAEKQYTLAASAIERARVNAEGQHVYLATFVRPVLPEDSIYPKRTLFSLLGIAAVALFYTAGKAVWAAARRKMAA